ncbi:hypothetical protein D3C85_1886920 [compost metagenome]
MSMASEPFSQLGVKQLVRKSGGIERFPVLVCRARSRIRFAFRFKPAYQLGLQI